MKHERIRQRRLELHLTQMHVAKFLSVSKSTVSQWESGATSPRGENLQGLANILQCSPNWLLYGKEDSKPAQSSLYRIPYSEAIKGKLPIISPAQAGKWLEIVKHFKASDALGWRETTATVGANAFFLRATGNSMTSPKGAPSIPDGSLVLIDPDITPINGTFVLALLEGAAEPILKQLIIDGPNQYLMSLNPDFRPILINEDCEIIGTVVKVEYDLLPPGLAS